MTKRPKARPIDVSPTAEADDQMHVKKKPVRPRQRPIDVSPTAEADDQMHIQKFGYGGKAEARGMKPAQMSGRGGCKNF